MDETITPIQDSEKLHSKNIKSADPDLILSSRRSPANVDDADHYGNEFYITETTTDTIVIKNYPENDSEMNEPILTSSEYIKTRHCTTDENHSDRNASVSISFKSIKTEKSNTEENQSTRNESTSLSSDFLKTGHSDYVNTEQPADDHSESDILSEIPQEDPTNVDKISQKLSDTKISVCQSEDDDSSTDSDCFTYGMGT